MANRAISTTLAALAAALLAAAGCGDESGSAPDGNAGKATTAGFDITGSWSGTLHQLGLGSFKVEAEIRSLETDDDNAVSYTVIDCSGTWSYDETTDDAFTFKEVIDAGEGDKCKGTGTVTLSPTGPNKLDYSFSGGGVESRGELVRD